MGLRACLVLLDLFSDLRLQQESGWQEVSRSSQVLAAEGGGSRGLIADKSAVAVVMVALGR